MSLPKFFSDLIDEVAVMNAAKANFPEFVHVMNSYRTEGKSFDQALAAFRARVEENDPGDPTTPEEQALLVRTFEISVERYRKMIEAGRSLAMWADPTLISIPMTEPNGYDFETGNAHPQFPFEDAQRRHPETGDAVDETGAIL